MVGPPSVVVVVTAATDMRVETTRTRTRMKGRVTDVRIGMLVASEGT